MTSDLCCIIYLLMNQNEIFSPLHKWEIGPIATHVLELIFHTAKMIQSFHYTFGKSRQFGPMFQYFRYRYLNCHFLSVTHRKNRDRPMIETFWQNHGVPAGVCELLTTLTTRWGCLTMTITTMTTTTQITTWMAKWTTT